MPANLQAALGRSGSARCDYPLPFWYLAQGQGESHMTRRYSVLKAGNTWAGLSGRRELAKSTVVALRNNHSFQGAFTNPRRLARSRTARSLPGAIIDQKQRRIDFLFALRAPGCSAQTLTRGTKKVARLSDRSRVTLVAFCSVINQGFDCLSWGAASTTSRLRHNALSACLVHQTTVAFSCRLSTWLRALRRYSQGPPRTRRSLSNNPPPWALLASVLMCFPTGHRHLFP
jgi:hypothetical protein